MDNYNNLIEQLKMYNPIKTSSVFSSLLLNPKYHYHQYTLEMIVKYCLSFCKGSQTPTRELIKNIYNEIHNNGRYGVSLSGGNNINVTNNHIVNNVYPKINLKMRFILITMTLFFKDNYNK